MNVGRRCHTRVGAMVAAAFVLVAVAAGCGIPEDSAPRALGPVLATPTAPPEPAASQQFTIYLLDTATRLLSPVTREVPEALNLQALLDQLTLPPTAEEGARGLATSIPAGTAFMNSPGPLVRDNGVAVLDFAAGSFDALLGTQLQEALAQLVYTFTESGSIDAVLVRVEGQRLPWPTSLGESTEPLRPEDYSSFDPNFVPAATPTPIPVEGESAGEGTG